VVVRLHGIQLLLVRSGDPQRLLLARRKRMPQLAAYRELSPSSKVASRGWLVRTMIPSAAGAWQAQPRPHVDWHNSPLMLMRGGAASLECTAALYAITLASRLLLSLALWACVGDGDEYKISSRETLLSVGECTGIGAWCGSVERFFSSCGECCLLLEVTITGGRYRSATTTCRTQSVSPATWRCSGRATYCRLLSAA
jgi:hypothetical protein